MESLPGMNGDIPRTATLALSAGLISSVTTLRVRCLVRGWLGALPPGDIPLFKVEMFNLLAGRGRGVCRRRGVAGAIGRRGDSDICSDCVGSLLRCEADSVDLSGIYSTTSLLAIQEEGTT